MPAAHRADGEFLGGLTKIKSRGPLVGPVYQSLKQAIISGQLPPGTWLPEPPLTQALGISRTPLREAFNRLESEGFIRVIPHRGAQVVQLSVAEIRDLFEARVAVESTFFIRAAQTLAPEELLEIKASFVRLQEEWDAAIGQEALWEEKRRAYLALDRAFHDRLIVAAGNDYWRGLYYNLRDKIEFFGHLLSRMPDRFRLARIEHLAIIEAILAGDYAKGRRIMRRHIMNVQISVVGAMPPGVTGESSEVRSPDRP